MRPNIQFCGIQGSGKGTQTRLLAASSGFTLISTGELLRASKAHEVRAAIKAGHLVPDELVRDTIDSFLGTHNEISGIIGDGMLRRLSQVELFSTLWEQDDFDTPLLIELRLSPEQALERIKKRGNEGNTRSDLSNAAIEKRIEAFFSETQPVIEHFRDQNCLISLDANQDVDSLAAAITEALQSYIAL